MGRFISRSISFAPDVWEKLEKLEPGARSRVVNDALREYLPKIKDEKKRLAEIDPDILQEAIRKELARMNLQSTPEPIREIAGETNDQNVDEMIGSFIKRRE